MTKKQKRQIKTFDDDYGRHALCVDRRRGGKVRDVMRLLAEQDLQIGISAVFLPRGYQPRHAASEAS